MLKVSIIQYVVIIWNWANDCYHSASCPDFELCWRLLSSSMLSRSGVALKVDVIQCRHNQLFWRLLSSSMSSCLAVVSKVTVIPSWFAVVLKIAIIYYIVMSWCCVQDCYHLLCRQEPHLGWWSLWSDMSSLSAVRLKVAIICVSSWSSIGQ